MKPLRKIETAKRVFCYNMSFLFTMKDFEDSKVLLNGKEYVICKPYDETALLLIPPEMFSDVTISRSEDG